MGRKSINSDKKAQVTMILAVNMLLATLAINYQVVWTNSHVEIPVGGTVTEYINLPTAAIYINGVKQAAPRLYYERGVDGTHLTVVKGHLVKTHKIFYRAIFPDQFNYSSKEVITLDVVDKVAPVIHNIPSVNYLVGTKKIDLLAGFEYSDNYYDKIKLKVSVLGADKVDTSVVGKYNIIYQVVDESNNIVEESSIVNIYDDIAPVIVQAKDIIIEVNSRSSPQYEKFYKFSDNYNVQLEVLFNDASVNYKKIGEYFLMVTVVDESGNRASKESKVAVIDSTPPGIVISNHELVITVHDMEYYAKVKNFILSVSDNYDELTIDDVIILEYIEIDKIGTFPVIYELVDSSSNSTIIEKKISVIDDIAPQIEVKIDLIVHVGEKLLVYDKYFSIIDNHDECESIKVIYSCAINLNKVGIYDIKIEATDISKNKKVWLGEISVVDVESPVVIQKQKIVVEAKLSVDWTIFFDISDNYDLKLEIEYDVSLININRPGEYEIGLQVMDQSGNQSIHNAPVTVVDLIPPTLVLKKRNEHIGYGTEVNLADYIESVYDNCDKMHISDVKISTQLDVNVIGRYEVVYEITDASDNINTQNITLIVIDNIPPTIKSKKITISVGENPNYYNDISAYDAYDNNITSHLVIINFPDTSSPGTKVIQYYITDYSGNICLHDRELVVILDNKIDYISIIPYVIIILAINIAFIYISKKRDNL